MGIYYLWFIMRIMLPKWNVFLTRKSYFASKVFKNKVILNQSFYKEHPHECK